MNFLEEYDEMDGYEKDDIPILDVREYYNVEDFEEDLNFYDKPNWVIIDNIIYKRKTAEEILKDKLKKKDVKSSGVRRKQ